MTAGLQLGVPGVYHTVQQHEAGPERIRLDATGFVGIAPRGPVNRPVRLTSWSDYVRVFGGVPRMDRAAPTPLLGPAVRAYFAQGGAVAWVLRVAPPTHPGSGAATLVSQPRRGLPALTLTAADEGRWGNQLSVIIGFERGAEFGVDVVDGSGPPMLLPPVGRGIAPYSLLQLRIGVTSQGRGPGTVSCWVTGTSTRVIGGARRTVYALDRTNATIPGQRVRASVVTGNLTIADHDPDGQRTERFDGLGLHPRHHRFISTVIGDDSALLADPKWTRPMNPGPGLDTVEFKNADNGRDRWDEIDYSSFFDDEPADADPLGEQTHRGVDAMGLSPNTTSVAGRQSVDEIGLLCVPDLSWTWRPGDSPRITAPISCGDGQFVPCDQDTVLSASLAPVPPANTVLSGADPADVEEILRRQHRVVDVANRHARFVALLDVPYGMAARDVPRWRSAFDSGYAAAYHPWLGVSADNAQTPVVFVPPTSFAAGIIAARELRRGVHWGPANELARTAVIASADVTDAEHMDLFTAGVNVFRAERDGYRLTSARTLSTDPRYRQLSVRRLMTLLTLTLRRVGDRLVFENHTPGLRAQLQQTVRSMLGEMFQQGAFAGTTEAQAYFVRCDDQLNDAQVRGQGQLVAEIGVAPASPMEFIVVRLVHGVDGTSVEIDHG